MAPRFFFVVGLALLIALPAAANADTASDVAARRAELQSQLDSLNAQIADQQKVLEQTQGESASFQKDIDVLAAQIKKDDLSIKARDLSIQTLTGDIGDKNQTISALDAKLGLELQSLGEILRKTHVLDEYTAPEVILSSDTVSRFFSDVNSFASIQSALQQSFSDISSTKTETAAERSDLEDKRSAEEALRQQQVIEENQVAANKKQEQTLLAISKAQEGQYQTQIQASQKVIAQIEAELFGLRDSAPIPFSQALSFANLASQKTGVRPAFILGILKQESDLGVNVGSCYVTDLATGAGIGKNTGTSFSNVMKAPRDTVPFQQITSALGIAWATAAVSCPQRIGYGGAMGPSQFIPSTWMTLTARLQRDLTVTQPNPWDAQTAIMATAIYLADRGADTQTYTSERNAACKYYSGSSCTSSTQFYGDAVMDNAGFFQNQIDIVGSS